MKISLWKIIGGINQLISNNSKYYVSSKILPKKFSAKIQLNEKYPHEPNSDCAIVLQGPLWIKENFTYETVALYNQIFPDVKIIVSTWEDENQSMINKLKTLKCCVIENKKIQDGGIRNINNQITTSLAGLQKAKQLGAKYVLKSRTDQRMYFPDALSYLKMLIKTFPVSIMPLDGKKSERIVIIDDFVNSKEGRKAFWLPDYFYFGVIDEVIRTIDQPFRNYSEFNDKVNKMTYEEQFENGLIPEIYFLRGYLSKYYDKQILRCDDWEIWSRAKAETLILISPWDVDLYWVKQRQRVYQPTNFMFVKGELCETGNQNFMKWLVNYYRYNNQV